jgi:hypothetical protein
LSAIRLKLVNFNGPFNTHGIDIYSPPEDPTSLYIAAVNHLPNPEFYAPSTSPKDSKNIPRARSRLEIFHHTIGTSEATHVRSIWHPLIRTPNDILFRSLREMYVTNDHVYRDGLMRLVEDLSYGSLVQQTDLIHLKLTTSLAATRDEKMKTDDDTVGVVATIANMGIHNNNGLAYGRTPSEILICRTAIGQLLLAEVDAAHSPALSIKETIQLPCTLDNPSYFADPYAAKTGRDASGFVLAGLARAVTFPDGLDSSMVWLVQASEKSGASHAQKSAVSAKKSEEGQWKQKLVFQDDGHILRTASTAVLVAIDPDENEGKKQAHLFVTGPLSKGVVVSIIDL